MPENFLAMGNSHRPKLSIIVKDFSSKQPSREIMVTAEELASVKKILESPLLKSCILQIANQSVGFQKRDLSQLQF